MLEIRILSLVLNYEAKECNNNNNNNINKILLEIYNRFNTETNDIITMNSNNRIDATLYCLGT